MPPIPMLFEVPIQPSGNIICTQPEPKVYLLTFTSPPDNRLTPSFNKAFLLSLEIIEQRYPKGVVVTTSGIAKFYSNGLDLNLAMADPRFFPDSMYPLWHKLLSYPMPTVALLNGHTFAGGLLTAMMQDYRIMNPHKGFLCMNELDFGAPLMPPMASIFRQKLPSPHTYRTVVLEAKRFNALEALKEGLVDGLGGPVEALAFIKEMKLVSKGESGVYGVLKAEMWRETLGFLENGGEPEKQELSARGAAADARKAQGAERIQEFAKSRPKL